jgi:hypothetical protein
LSRVFACPSSSAVRRSGFRCPLPRGGESLQSIEATTSQDSTTPDLWQFSVKYRSLQVTVTLLRILRRTGLHLPTSYYFGDSLVKPESRVRTVPSYNHLQKLDLKRAGIHLDNCSNKPGDNILHLIQRKGNRALDRVWLRPREPAQWGQFAVVHRADML